MLFSFLEMVRGFLTPYPFWLRNTGRLGEYLALRYYRRKGFHKVAANWRHGHGELDLIVANWRELVFVEVKTRRLPEGLEMPLVLGEDQRERLLRLADRYLQQWPENHFPRRFDLVVIRLGKGRLYDLRKGPLQAG